MGIKASISKKMHKSGKFEERKVRRGRKAHGSICYYPCGTVIYWMKVLECSMYRKTSSWAMDSETLAEVKLYGTKLVGIHVTDTGDKYLAKIGDFTDASRGAVRLKDSETLIAGASALKWGDRLRWYLPRSSMAQSLSTKERKDATLSDMMKV